MKPLSYTLHHFVYNILHRLLTVIKNSVTIVLHRHHMIVNKTYTVTDLFVYYIIYLCLPIECKKTLSTKKQTVRHMLSVTKNNKLNKYSVIHYMIIYLLSKLLEGFFDPLTHN